MAPVRRLANLHWHVTKRSDSNSDIDLPLGPMRFGHCAGARAFRSVPAKRTGRRQRRSRSLRQRFGQSSPRTATSAMGLQSRKAALRLDSRSALTAGGEQGQVVVPGHPEQSLLVKARPTRRRAENAAGKEACGPTNRASDAMGEDGSAVAGSRAAGRAASPQRASGHRQGPSALGLSVE